ncbi:hypothetical protein SAMN05216327_11824 [Dyadobacter sp. SG02]|uniref:hypothetical protein n=1 Tax=Dyadobacter sp. SG02 TaxID=1855291 RepID=UPI0008D8560B|nr:hypothetical protein [Dyadobacter sp. SG02]SEJ74500.1 hypothetical protein SAMN05216327_11824 [Dyadobacter sp. SG02]
MFKLNRKKRKHRRGRAQTGVIITDENAAGFRFGAGIKKKLEQTGEKIGTTLNEKQFAFGPLTRNIILLLILGAAFLYFSIDIIKAFNLIF